MRGSVKLHGRLIIFQSGCDSQPRNKVYSLLGLDLEDKEVLGWMGEPETAQVLDDCYSAVADDYRDHIFGAAFYRVCIRNEVSGKSGSEDSGGMRAVRWKKV